MTKHISVAGTAALCVFGLLTGDDVLAQRRPAPSAVALKPAAAQAANSVTMTGCLEAEGRRYLLTDVDGLQAPKGRNWKTGFLTKKRAPEIQVVPASNVRLGDHIGHKVSVSGVKEGEAQLQARAVKQVAASCL